MKARIIIFFLSITVSCGLSVNAQDRRITEYTSFLREQKLDPKEYTLSLFEKHDLVILCERYHADTTQYEFILDLFGDPEFYNQAGTIFFEIGGAHLTPMVNEFLTKTGLSEEEVEKEAIRIQRLAHWRPFWNNYTFTILLKGLYNINQNLDETHKLRLVFCDYPFDWTTIKKKKDVYDVNAHPNERDEIMAKTIIDNFDQISQNSKRKKAVAILNDIHAYTNKTYIRNSTIKPRWFVSAGAHLKDHYKSRLANVLINSLASDGYLIDHGRWDAAFALNGNKPVGFNFENSPFGDTDFKVASENSDLTYQEVFTGMIFYKPLQEHVLRYGYEKYITDDFVKEMARRNKIWISDHPTDAATIKKWYNTRQAVKYNKMDSLNIAIQNLVDDNR